MNLNFGEVLTKAWQIIWKFKVLWIFGIMAGCASGGGGGGNSRFNYNYSGNNPGSVNLPPEIQRFFTQLSHNTGLLIGIVAGLLLFFCILWILFLVIGTIGRIGLIKGTLKADEGAEHLGFAELWTESTPYFWRVFLLLLLVWFTTFVLVLLLLIPAIGFAALTAGIGLLCLCCLVPILIPIIILINLVLEQAIISIIAEDRGIADSLGRGWEVVRLNLGPVLVMALILFVIQVVFGFVLALPFILIAIPAIVGFAIGGDIAIRATLIIAAIGFLVYLLIYLLLHGIAIAYVESAWTLTFSRLTHPVPPATPAIPAPVENPEPQ